MVAILVVTMLRVITTVVIVVVLQGTTATTTTMPLLLRGTTTTTTMARARHCAELGGKVMDGVIVPVTMQHVITMVGIVRHCQHHRPQVHHHQITFLLLRQVLAAPEVAQRPG